LEKELLHMRNRRQVILAAIVTAALGAGVPV
jgi:hypothetical protein